MHKLGMRKVYFFGIIVTALCALAFGCLDFVQDKTTFLVLSYMLRVFEGIKCLLIFHTVETFKPPTYVPKPGLVNLY